MELQTKTDAEMTDAERIERNARRVAIRMQIRDDQRANDKRDAKALKAERDWYRKNGQNQ